MGARAERTAPEGQKALPHTTTQHHATQQDKTHDTHTHGTHPSLNKGGAAGGHTRHKKDYTTQRPSATVGIGAGATRDGARAADGSGRQGRRTEVQRVAPKNSMIQGKSYAKNRL